MSSLRLCRDCRWRRRNLVFEEKCAHQIVSPAQVDIVTGSTRPKRLYCSTARLSGSPCGPDGELWVQRC